MYKSKIVSVNELPKDVLSKWHKMVHIFEHDKNWIKQECDIWTDGCFYCCCYYGSNVVFVSHLANINKCRYVVEFLRDIIDYYKPEFLVGYRGNYCVFYHTFSNRIKRLPKTIVEDMLNRYVNIIGGV